jgi:uncharacterized membrane protein YkvA (DUF1232 family)
MEVQIFYFAFKHPRAPWYARLIASCIAGYVLSPIQLIPSFIPVIGILDDLLVLFLGTKLLKMTIPQDVFSECRALAEDASIRSEERLRSRAVVSAFAAVAAIWLLIAIGGVVFAAAHVFH